MISEEQLSKMKKRELVVLVSTLLKKRIDSLRNIGEERNLYERHVRRLEEEIKTLKEWVRAANQSFRDEKHNRQTLEKHLQRKHRTVKRHVKPNAGWGLVSSCDTHLL